MRRPRKLTVSVLALLGCSVLAATAFALRFDIVEAWHLWQLGSRDGNARLAALEGLRQVGSHRSVPGILEVIRSDESLRGTAVDVLLAAGPRMRPERREEAALALRDMVGTGTAEAARALRSLGPECPGIFPILAEDLEGTDTNLRSVAVDVLVTAWPRSRASVFRFASAAKENDILGFLKRVCLPGEDTTPGSMTMPAAKAWMRAIRGGITKGPVPAFLARPGSRDVALALSSEHERPEARAAALSFAVVRWDQNQNPGGLDLSLLVPAYRDSSFLVRRTALRIAGYLGDVEGNLDLPEVIASERDPALLAEAIEARDSWSRYQLRGKSEHAGSRGARLVEPPSHEIVLWDGAPVTWLFAGFTPPGRPWSEEECRVLEKLLLENDHPALRDAASRALAGRYRMFRDSVAGPPPSRPDLRVHEWAVWRDSRSSLEPAEPAADPSGLPAASDEEAHATAVLFFESASPLPLLVRVEGVAGLEWCGLRIGYSGELERPMKEADPDAFRSRLRRVPAKTVAFQGDGEPFLLHRRGTHSPLRVFCEGPWPCRRLLIVARPLDDFPGFPDRRCDEDRKGDPLPAALIIEKASGGPLRGKLIEGIDPDRPPRAVDLARELDLEGDAVPRALRAAVLREGLTPPEAEALIDLWKERLFEASGVRVLTLLPRWLQDGQAPLEVFPAPGSIARVGIVWKEVGECDQLGAVSEPTNRTLLWELQGGDRKELQLDILEDGLPPLAAEPLVLDANQGMPGIVLDISADGDRVLLRQDTCSVHGRESTPCRYSIVDLRERRVMDLPLKAWAGQGMSPILSGDGRKVAFSSWELEKWRVHVADLDRGKLATIALDPQAFPKTALSRDGRRLAVFTVRGIAVVDLESRRSWLLTLDSIRDAVLEVSGDGRRAACILGAQDIHIVDLDTGASLDISRSLGRSWGPSLSHDGKRVAFLRTVGTETAVWVADLEVRSRTRVSTEAPIVAEFPSMASHGKRVAFTSRGMVRVRELDTGRVIDVPGTEGGSSPLLSADGSRLAFTRREGVFHTYFAEVEAPHSP